MSQPTASNPNRRVLIIDDTQSIHDDYAKILRPNRPSAEETGLDGLDELDKLIFEDEGAAGSNNAFIDFDVSHALQGQEGVALVSRALQEEEPIALAFVDMRMPPGWDGLETIEQIREVDPDMLFIIVTAYSDHTFETIVERLGPSVPVRILYKPFDPRVIYKTAYRMVSRWNETNAR